MDISNLESPLIFYLFLKGKQDKKENHKCDSLFGKNKFVKNRVWVQGSGYLLERYGGEPYHPSKHIYVWPILNELREL